MATRYGLKKKAVEAKMRIGVDLNQVKLVFSPSRYHFFTETLNSLAKIAPLSTQKKKEDQRQSWFEKNAANILTHGYVFIIVFLDGLISACSINSHSRPVSFFF